MQIGEGFSVTAALLTGEGGMLVAFAGIAWKVVRRLNRDESLRADYPPHRHINGSIIYPNEYTPSAVGHISHGGD